MMPLGPPSRAARLRLDARLAARLEVTELVCEDCVEGDHEACRRSGGWPYQDTNERCGCHLTEHALDNRGDNNVPREHS